MQKRKYIGNIFIKKKKENTEETGKTRKKMQKNRKPFMNVILLSPHIQIATANVIACNQFMHTMFNIFYAKIDDDITFGKINR